MARMSEAAKARGNEASLARHNQLIEHGLCCACKKPREPERRLKTRCNACAAKARAYSQAYRDKVRTTGDYNWSQLMKAKVQALSLELRETRRQLRDMAWERDVMRGIVMDLRNNIHGYFAKSPAQQLQADLDDLEAELREVTKQCKCGGGLSE